MKESSVWQFILRIVARIGIDEREDEDRRLEKEILIITTLIIIIAGVVWGLLYFHFDEFLAGTIPLFYSLLSGVNVVALKVYRHYRTFRFIQLSLILVLPFLLLLVLGGIVNSSAVILWSFLAPLGALLCCKSPQYIYWFAAYIVLLIAGGLLQPYLRAENNLPELLTLSLFILNAGAVSTIAFVVLNYFVNAKDMAIELMRRNRELEQAYLQQEVMLRQSEKLATLGKLSAGIAHEMNNPASAVQRNIKQLRESIDRLRQAEYRFSLLHRTEREYRALVPYTEMADQRAARPLVIDPIARNEREEEVETWLKEQGLDNSWEFAPLLVDLGYTEDELEALAERFPGNRFPVAAALLCNHFSTLSLLEEADRGIVRITAIIKALKSYTYLDQAPVQTVNVHEGLDDTLVMLKNRIGGGITVQRKYAEGLPGIQAYGSELNQVWTNILDNALDAIEGNGRIEIKTSYDDQQVTVEITDSGKGIPADIQPKIFDPFITTKPPGEGSGLGLNVSHNIVVQKHGGSLSVDSKPGETHFVVSLPRSANR